MLHKMLLVIVLLGGASFTHAQAPETQTQAEIEQIVRELFIDSPEMIEIARCESKFRQFTDAGNVFRGGYGNNMVGVFQFYESVHQQAATDLGHDLTTVAGNLGYAQHVYQLSGTTPWNSSKYCWHNTTSEPTYPLASAVITTTNTETSLTDAQMREKIELLHQLIKVLQTLLELKQAQGL